MTKELSMQELLDQQEQLLSTIQVGEIITGTITKVNHDEVTVGLSVGFDGVISASELNLDKNAEIEDVYKVGDEISAIIIKVSEKDGTLKLSKLKLDMINDKKEIEQAHADHKIITVNVVKTIQRGVFARYKSVELFIPISQLNTKFVNDTKEYQDANLEVYVIEFNEKSGKMVASHREVLQERLDQERKERRERIQAEREAERQRVRAERKAEKERVEAEKKSLVDSLEVGQKRHGKVTNIVSYGAFIDLGGVEGLAHINNLSWKRVESVEDMLEVGQEVDVYVLEVNKETQRIGLALKDINNDPWDLIAKEVNVDDVITGKVVRLIDRGAFVEIKEGVEAFLPISHLSENRVANVSSVVNPGDEITVRVLTFDPSHKRMSVSIKDVNKEPEEDYSEFLNTEEELGSTIGDLLKGKLNNR
ncbi:30S ribosomal protein S1 [Terrisporobacter sp.]|uniref:30S ribosomal protein S1 n=1 Tax=Terrisporobacter sp. TaxID=1965305 RepID=UPI00260E312D|nr:S1 RNA-binding domain-containing protein [Terrisporobacter sp.]